MGTVAGKTNRSDFKQNPATPQMSVNSKQCAPYMSLFIMFECG